MTQAAQQTETSTELVLSKAILEQFAQMVSVIPMRTSGGQEAILAKIFAATTADELDSAWDERDAELPLGKPVEVLSVELAQSDYPGGLGFYLYLTCVDLDTGEQVEYQTGSVSIVGQLCKAYVEGMLPMLIKAVAAEKPSKSGNFPQHLEIIERTAPAKGSRRGK